MSLITLDFFIFLCVMLVAYYMAPKFLGSEVQWMILLAGSLIFYAYASPKYLIFILVSAASSFCLAKLIEAEKIKVAKSKDNDTQNEAKIKDNSKLYLILAIVINIGILAVLKYTGMLFEIVGAFSKLKIPAVHFILPLGISFYTFMIVSYVVDVYKGDTEAEDNFLKYLLFVSFFPQIIEGPINRYNRIKNTMFAPHEFDFNHCKKAGYRILQGLFKKVVIAGRFGVYVDTVFENVSAYGGLTLFVSMIFYAIQLYADFSGCMDMVLGIAELFGVTMEENFDLPFFAKSVAEFWRRWHISLGTWFRDYIYNPVMQSASSKTLKQKLHKTSLKKWSMNIVAARALLVVWLLTGIWHGGSVKFAVYGLYWGVIIIASLFLTKQFKKFHKKHPKLVESKGYAVFQMLRTFILVDIGLMMFRADNLRDVCEVLKGVVTRFAINVDSISEALLPFTGDNTAVSYGAVACVSALMLFIVELFEYNKKDTFKKHKYINAVVLIVVTLLFGVFGTSGFLYMAY